jgi:hypothetical protein
MLSRSTRSGERGQSLIMALGFLAVFALLAGTVLTLAGTAESQRGSTERTAATNSVAEGSAQFALADTRSHPCGTITSGSMQFPSTIRADTLTYSVASCTPSSKTNNTAGSSCELCILNSGSPPQLATAALTVSPAGNSLTVNGELDSNGSIAGPGSVTSTGPNAKIGLYKYPTGASCASCTPTPTALPTPFLDPLAGALPLPTSSTVQSCCASGINPGVYSGMSITNTVVMSSGVYIVTGPISISGGKGLLTNSDASSGSSTDSDSGGAIDSDSGGTTDSDSGDSNSGAGVTYPSNTTLTDTSKNWTANQWVNALVTVTLSGNKTASGTVVSNTLNTLTVGSNWGTNPPPNGSAYAVSAISYASNTLQDTSKNWTTSWAGAVVTVTLSNGTIESDTVKTSTTNTLTMNSNWGTVPSAVNAYVVSSKIGYTATTLVDTSRNWTPTQWPPGAVVTVTLTNGTRVTDTVASNTANTLTMSSPWGTVPSAGNLYTVSTIGYTANTLVDTSKNWTTSWGGALVTVTLTNGTRVTDTVASNTANTLTMKSPWGTIPSAGNAYLVSTIGYTNTPTATLTDTVKSWAPNVWNGAVVTVTLTTGNGATISYGSTSLTDTAMNWSINQWAGTTTAVTLADGTQETDTIASNTSNTLTMTSAWGTTPGNGTSYAITEAGTVAGNSASTLTMSSPWGTLPAPGSQYSVVAAVVIYLACPTSAPYWSCATAGQQGGSLSTTGQGTLNVNAAASGPYSGIALFTDANLIDPSGGSVVNVAGNGGSIGGTVYAPRGTLSISGGGAAGSGVNVAGRVIVRDLSISGNALPKLRFTGPAPASGLMYCYYYNDSLMGTEAGGTNRSGDVLFETGCDSAGLSADGTSTTPTSIINFAYVGPGP